MSFFSEPGMSMSTPEGFIVPAAVAEGTANAPTGVRPVLVRSCRKDSPLTGDLRAGVKRAPSAASSLRGVARLLGL